MKRWWFAMGLLLASTALPATFGVPTNLNANGTTSGTTVVPPGWIEVFGTDAAITLGDAVHQARYFIEVTGTTLDILIFDAGASGTRDFAGNNDVTTTFSLRSPSGTTITSQSIGNDTNTTQDRLARFTPNGFFAPNDGNGNNVSFSGLTPGLYELRISTGGGDEGNFFGLDIRTAKGSTTHYNAYTVGTNTNPVSGFLSGGNTNATAPITQPVTVFPYVTRGCSFFTSNFDGDGTDTASMSDVVGGAATNIPLSGDGVRTEATLTIEATGAQNVKIDNYGLWRLTYDPGTTNAIDWRFADFNGWADAPANAPRGPSNALRLYLPNGYNPVAGNANAVVPAKPMLAVGASVVSGANPLQVGQTTRIVITGSLRNTTSAALTNAQVSVGIATGTFVAGSQQCLVNGTVTACTDGSGAGFRRGTLASLAANATLSLRFQVDVTPTAAGILNITGAPAAGATPPNTTTWGQYTSNYAVTEQLGPVCQMAVNVGGATRLVTPARIAGAAFDGRELVFAATMQLGTQGFQLWQGESKDGSDRVRLGALIQTNEPDTLRPTLYRQTVPDLRGGWLFVEEIAAEGKAQIVATLPVRELSAPGALERLLSLMKIDDVVRTKFDSTPRFEVLRPGATFSGLTLFVPKGGKVDVSRAALESAGLPRGLTAVDLFHRGLPLASSWTPNFDTLQFEAPSFASQYTGESVITLMPRGFRPEAPQVTFTWMEAPRTARRIERNGIYYALTRPTRSPWFWSLLRSNAAWPLPTDALAGTFDLPNVAGTTGAIPLRIGLMGRSGHHQRVEAKLNGIVVGSVDFEGTAEATLDGSIDASSLREVGNQLTMTLTSTANSPDDVGLGFVYLDFIDFDGLPALPTPSASVARIGTFFGPIPSLRTVNTLIVTHGKFWLEAQELAALKEQEGQHTFVVDVAQVYEAFSSGQVEANAIHALIKRAHREGVVNVLLMGDDTFDPRDFTGQRQQSFVPSLDGWDGEFGRVPSENRYADVDGDGLPDLAIGRLPVQTRAQAQVLVNKLGRYVLRTPSTDHVIVVDGRTAQDDDFLARAQTLQTTLGGATIIDVSAGATAARTQLAQAIASGPASLHYFGHGSPTALSNQSVWTTTDSQANATAFGDSVGFQWACFAQWYQYAFGPSLGESLLLMPNGGLTASFGPTGISQPERQVALSQKVYHYVYGSHLSLGEAIRRAKRDVLIADPTAQAIVDGWNLLGDPAMVPAPRPRNSLSRP